MTNPLSPPATNVRRGLAFSLIFGSAFQTTVRNQFTNSTLENAIA